MSFLTELKERTEKAEKTVLNWLPKEEGYQRYLLEAANYSVTVGGKRLRPLIMQATFEALGGKSRVVEPFMAALEMIHSASLVHDDLPCMDNDEYRRGCLTTWKKYGYDMAVLAGDAFFIYPFEVASRAFDMTEDAKAVGRALQILANKAGIYGMIGGQSVDVELTGKPIPKNELDFIYRLKTGALLEASMMIAAVLANASSEQIQLAGEIALSVGMAFQIQDDILDVTSTTEQLGKPVCSDEKNNKTTYVSMHSLEEAKKLVENYSHKAIALLEVLCPEDRFLKQLFEYLISRDK